MNPLTKRAALYLFVADFMCMQVSTAYGPFWGWMEGYCSWVSGVADNSLCESRTRSL